jgi:putative membrane protein
MYYILRHWSPAWPVLAAWIVIAALHLLGLHRLSRAEPAPVGGPAAARVARLRREAGVFHLGLLTVLIAVVSPVAYWAVVYIWVRSMQDLLLAFIAPALLVLGAPWLVLASGLRLAPRRADGAAAAATAAADTVAGSGRRWWLAWPLAAVVAFNVAWLGWHVPALFDHSARNGPARYAEYACYLGFGVLFWLQLIGSRPSSPVLAPLTRLKYLVVTVAADTILGMALVFGSAEVYHAYGGHAHHVLSVVADQQVAGAVLWMGVLPPLIIVAVALLHTWLENEESDELSRDLDRVLGRPTAPAGQAGQGRGAWHARPGYRRPTI